MAYCVRCGEKVGDTVVTCPVCGAVIPKTEPSTQNIGYTYGSTDFQSGGENTYNVYYGAQTKEGCFPENEVKNNKIMAILCYIGILVFVPILAGDRDSEYLKLHKNQGLMLFIIDTLFNVIEKNWGWSAGFFSWLTGGMLGVACDIVQVVILILWVMGLTRACRGSKTELPGIGKIKIFK